MTKVVRAGDGREIFLTESSGPVNRDGSHASLDDVVPEPAPEPEVKAESGPKRGPRATAK